MTTLYTKATVLNQAISAAYQDCLRATRKELGGCIRSRGKFVYVSHGDRIDPRSEAEGWPFKGTQKELNALLAEAESDPTITNVTIQGGLDYAESVRDFGEGWYDPWVGDWAVEVFSREEI